LDQNEYEALLASIEQMIEISLRGNRRGNHFQILSDDDNGDKFLDANALGIAKVGVD
jgi:hypothetical protein